MGRLVVARHKHELTGLAVMMSLIRKLASSAVGLMFRRTSRLTFTFEEVFDKTLALKLVLLSILVRGHLRKGPN